jgi:hypothetical protein
VAIAPVSKPNSLPTGNFAGKFPDLTTWRRDTSRKSANVQHLLSRFPKPANRELSRANRVFPAALQAIPPENLFREDCPRALHLGDDDPGLLHRLLGLSPPQPSCRSPIFPTTSARQGDGLRAVFTSGWIRKYDWRRFMLLTVLTISGSEHGRTANAPKPWSKCSAGPLLGVGSLDAGGGRARS